MQHVILCQMENCVFFYSENSELGDASNINRSQIATWRQKWKKKPVLNRQPTADDLENAENSDKSAKIPIFAFLDINRPPMAGDLDFSEFRNTQNIDGRVCQFFLLYLITSALRPQLNWSLTNLWKSKNQSVNGD